jgi:hypothetical protein
MKAGKASAGTTKRSMRKIDAAWLAGVVMVEAPAKHGFEPGWACTVKPHVKLRSRGDV